MILLQQVKHNLGFVLQRRFIQFPAVRLRFYGRQTVIEACLRAIGIISALTVSYIIPVKRCFRSLDLNIHFYSSGEITVISFMIDENLSVNIFVCVYISTEYSYPHEFNSPNILTAKYVFLAFTPMMGEQLVLTYSTL